MKTEVVMRWSPGETALVAVIVASVVTELYFVGEGENPVNHQLHFSEKLMRSLTREIHNPDENWKSLAVVNVRDENFASNFINGEFFIKRVNKLITAPDFADIHAKMTPAARPRKEKVVNPDAPKPEKTGKRGRPKKTPETKSI